MKPVDPARNALAFLEDERHQQAFDNLIRDLRVRRDSAACEPPEWENQVPGISGPNQGVG